MGSNNRSDVRRYLLWQFQPSRAVHAVLHHAKAVVQRIFDFLVINSPEIKLHDTLHLKQESLVPSKVFPNSFNKEFYKLSWFPYEHCLVLAILRWGSKCLMNMLRNRACNSVPKYRMHLFSVHTFGKCMTKWKFTSRPPCTHGCKLTPFGALALRCLQWRVCQEVPGSFAVW